MAQLSRRWVAVGYCLGVLCVFAAWVVSLRPAKAEPTNINIDDEIVYFDLDRVIHVFDPQPSSADFEVRWSSPEGGWDDFALGDLTGDTDYEIVAIRAVGTGGILTVFDPVAQDSPVEQTEVMAGVPWARLYDLELPRPPRLIATGQFDRTRPGHEILVSYGEPNGNDRFIILRATGEGLPGRAWEELVSWEQEGRWSAIATGNVVTEDAIDEIGLVSVARAELGLFRISPSIDQIFTNVNREHPWTDVALGQYVDVDGDGDEIGAVRDADFPLASAWVFRYTGPGFVDVLGEQLMPSPNVVFFADIRGNGDDELVMLRQSPQELGPRPRLIVRDGNNNDTLTLREDLLDGDNAYKGGDGGDVDGDGRDEIVLVRNNRIRIYYEPESSVNYTLIERVTNSEKVVLGNVDAAGLAARSALAASRTELSATLPPAAVSGPISVTVRDATKGLNIRYNVRVEYDVPVDGESEWIRVEPLNGVTPGVVTVRFDATEVNPGQHTGRLVIDAPATNVDNDPLYIDLTLTVRALITADPSLILFDYYPCEEPLPPRSQNVELSASSALTYSARIEGNPDWLTVTMDENVLPSTITVTVDPARRPAGMGVPDLLVTVHRDEEQEVEHRFPIFITCRRVFAPVIKR